MLRADQLHAQRACLLVIDVQEKLAPLIHGHDQVIRCGRKLLEGSRAFGLPIVATEQYPKGLGPTVGPLREVLSEAGGLVLEKPTFSGWAHPPVRDALRSLDRPQVVLMGIETHVCVQQTALDLASRDYDVFVCADAVGSRGRLDHEHALARMRQGGVFVTTVESVLFELCGRCDVPKFKEMLEVIKRYPPSERS
jgi:nicotinamidase-related amidase